MEDAGRGVAEQERLRQAREEGVPWRKWGPYLSERAVGHGQGGLQRQRRRLEQLSSRPGPLARLSLGRRRHRRHFRRADAAVLRPRLLERAGPDHQGAAVRAHQLGGQPRRGREGVLLLPRATPTSSYLKQLYKYPQMAFPYDELVHGNATRSRHELEYELIDTGVFDADRYFDVFVEYAKAGPEEILIRISAVNRGPESADLRILPHLWFRNTWWREPDAPRPSLERGPARRGSKTVVAQHPALGTRYLVCENAGELLFTQNESNQAPPRGRTNPSPYVKDGINDFIVKGAQESVDPSGRGTKAAAHYALTIGPGETRVVRLLLTDKAPSARQDAFAAFDETFAARIREADDFYAALTPSTISDDAASVMRQGFAGMLWSKQCYIYDSARGSRSAGSVPPTGRTSGVRNRDWYHMQNIDVISMPDKWEYPWYAAWDLAFHTIPLAMVDPDFALQQLELMLGARYAHPNGQIPAYEWNFSDVNPPVHAWATLFNYRLQRSLFGDRALPSLRRSFHKLLLNFTWWVNRKDRNGRNVFEGGFLGLDNIGVFDRSAPLPTGGYLEQADGTAWMALFSQNMLEMALELALHDSAYEELATKFYEHFVWIASAMDRIGDGDDMWDDTDGFYYDVLRLPDGSAQRLKVRSMVGLLPFCAITVYPEEVLTRLPSFVERAQDFNQRHPALLHSINPPGRAGVQGRRMLSVLDESQDPTGARSHARSERIPERLRHSCALPIPPGSSLCLPERGRGVRGGVRSGGVGLRIVRGEFQLARADLAAGQRAPDTGAAPAVHVLRGRCSPSSSRPAPAIT